MMCKKDFLIEFEIKDHKNVYVRVIVLWNCEIMEKSLWMTTMNKLFD